MRKAKTVSKQKQDADQVLRAKVLAGKGEAADDMDFLKSIAQKSLSNI